MVAVGSESTDSRWVALPTGALALAGELLGVPVALIGRLAGGETGAFEVRDEQGRRLVLKGDDRPGSFAARRDAVYLTTLLAGAGWPVPRQWIATTDDLKVVVQELLPGEPVDFVTHPVLDQLLSWHSARRDIAPASEPDGVVSELRRTLVTGGDGYCDHDALRGHSDRAGAFVEHIQEVGRRWEPNSRHRDVVHWDLHPGNVLAVDGRCTAVIDSEFARVGDAGFDLVLLAVTAAEHRMQPGVADRLWAAVDAEVTAPDRIAYTAHILLRLTSWCIRNYGGQDLNRWLDEADRLLPA